MKIAQAVIENLEKKNFKRWIKHPMYRLYYNGSADKAYYDLISGEYVCDNQDTVEIMKSIIEAEVKSHQDRMHHQEMEHILKEKEEKLDVDFVRFLIDTVPSSDYCNFIKAGIFDEYSYWVWRNDDDAYSKAKSLYRKFNEQAEDEANASGKFHYHVRFNLDYRNSGRVAKAILEFRKQFGYEEKLTAIMKEIGFTDKEYISRNVSYSDHGIHENIRTEDAFGYPTEELDFGIWTN